MRIRCSSLLWVAALLVGSCLHEPNKFQPLQEAADGPSGSPRGEGGTAGAAGGSSGTGATGGAATGGAAGSVSILDADRPFDAEQPAGGCGAPSRTCAGNVLQICEPSGELTSTMCAQGCDPVRLACNQCKPNSRTCSGANQIACNAEGTETTSTPCTSGCNAASGECNGCQPSTTWCNGDVLRECTAAAEQRDKQTCTEGCNSARMACNACRPGAKICNGNILETCKLDGTGTTTETCSSGCNTTRMACNACEPGAKMCSGATLRTCKTDGTGFAEEPCANGCSSNRCNACNPNQPATCDGSTLKECMPDGSAVRTTPCARGCASGACCTGNTESMGGSCGTCGTEGQLCCRIAQPGCTGSLACQPNGRCAVPCGNASGQRCCDGSTMTCQNNCGRQGERRCSNGTFGACSIGTFECCPPMERCTGTNNTTHQTCNNAGQWASDGSDECKKAPGQGPCSSGNDCTTGRCNTGARVCCAANGCCGDGDCGNGQRCMSGQCRCPQNTNDVGGTCVACGGGIGQPCCESSRPCRGQRLICQTGPETCIICGGEGDGCCGPERTNSSGTFPDSPGQCFEAGAECFRSTGTSPGFSCG